MLLLRMNGVLLTATCVHQLERCYDRIGRHWGSCPEGDEADARHCEHATLRGQRQLAWPLGAPSCSRWVTRMISCMSSSSIRRSTCGQRSSRPFGFCPKSAIFGHRGHRRVVRRTPITSEPEPWLPTKTEGNVCVNCSRERLPSSPAGGVGVWDGRQWNCLLKKGARVVVCGRQ